MKKNILLLLLFPLSLRVNAQVYQSAMSDDSSRVVELKEIQVNTVTRSAKNQLIRFYRADQAATLEHIISRLPEISLMRRGAYGMEPLIRSFSGGQINILLDGMRIHGACTDKMDPVTIYVEPVNLDNLQVQTPLSGFSSGSAIGGSLQLKMSEPDFGLPGTLSGRFSSGFQTASVSFFESVKLNYSREKWALHVTGTYRKSNNYRAGGGQEISFSGYEKLNYSLSVKNRLKERLYLKTDLLADDGWNIGFPALPMDVGFARARIGSLALIRENSSGKTNKWQAKIYANNVRHYMDDAERPGLTVRMDMPGNSSTYGGFFEADLKPSAFNRLQFRADASVTMLKASMTMYQQGQPPMYMLTWPDNQKGQYGIGITWTLPLDSSTRLQLTGRSDFIRYQLTTAEAKATMNIFGFESPDRNDWLKNISFQFTRKLRGSFRLSAGLAYSERMATASELYGNYLFNSSDGFDYTGNPLLKKENSFHAEATGTYERNLCRVQLSLFYSHIRNYITGIVNPEYRSMTYGARGVKSYVNLPGAAIAGIELTGVIRVHKAIEWVSTFRYTYGRDQKNIPLPSISPLKTVQNVRYKSKRFSAGMESESALRQNRISAYAGEDRTPGYWILHARMGYTFQVKHSKLELQVSAENLLDRKYHEHLDWGNLPRPGRNIAVQLTLGF